MLRHFRFGVLALIAAAFCLFGGSVAAQPSRSTLGASQNSETVTFLQALETLAKKYNVAFVAEEEPFSTRTVSRSLLDSPVTASPVPFADVQRVAEAFDYNAERTGGLFLLRKRFSVADDLPCVTLPEAALAFKDIARVLDRLNPHVADIEMHQGKVTAPLVQRLMESLTQDQLAAMFNGALNTGLTDDGKPLRGVLPNGILTPPGKQPSSKGIVELGLPFKSLNTEQQAEVGRITNYFYIQLPLRDFEVGSPRLQALSAAEPPLLRFITYTSGQDAWRLFGYEEKGTAGEKTKFYALFIERLTDANRAAVPVADGNAFAIVDKRLTVVNKSSGTTAFLIVPGAVQISEEKLVALPSITASQTIQQIVARFNARTNPADTKISTDDALREKRVTLIGADSLSGPTVLQAISRLYNLRTEQSTDKTVRLARLRVSALASSSDVPVTLERLLPNSLLRALVGDAARIERYRDLKTRLARDRPFDASGDSIQWNAALRLNTIAQERIKKSSDGTCRVTDLGDEGRRCLALVSMSGLDALRERISEPIPEMIAHPQSILLTGGLFLDQKDKVRFSLFVSRQIMPGVLAGGPGVGNVPYKW